jgi:Trk K+ transport system NAD-binding subunit
VAADATDEDAMRGLNIEGFDAAAVMMGENHVEACILATATLKEVGVPTRSWRGPRAVSTLGSSLDRSPLVEPDGR